MNNQEAYNAWADNYDTVHNKTRDLEAIALRQSIQSQELLNILEAGCGTGKNTEWLQRKAENLICTDFSEEMLNKAKEKIKGKNVTFQQLDLRNEWDFSESYFNLIVCSLVLEHIENIDFIFQQAHKVLKTGGQFYIGELHPFKQYHGSKAKFDTEKGIFELECFVHHISDFFRAASKHNLECIDLKEWFDEDDRTSVPRILSMVFRKT